MDDVWYYAENGEAIGPFGLRELGQILSRVSRGGRVLVWHARLPEWTAATEVEELRPFLRLPPPVPSSAAPPLPAFVVESGSRAGKPDATDGQVTALAGIVAAMWCASLYAGYKNIELVVPILALLSLSIIVALWRWKGRVTAGVTVGVIVGALSGLFVAANRLEFDKAIAAGFSSTADMVAAQRLNMSPDQFATHQAEQKALEEKEKACRKDWSQCANNSDVVNKYADWTRVQVRCQLAANDRAKYGDPEWPTLSFGSYRPGDDYVKTGVATAIEPDARFQNGFGAKVRSRVICTYDLRSQTVTNVIILEK